MSLKILHNRKRLLWRTDVKAIEGEIHVLYHRHRVSSVEVLPPLNRYSVVTVTLLCDERFF